MNPFSLFSFFRKRKKRTTSPQLSIEDRAVLASEAVCYLVDTTVEKTLLGHPTLNGEVVEELQKLSDSQRKKLGQILHCFWLFVAQAYIFMKIFADDQQAKYFEQLLNRAHKDKTGKDLSKKFSRIRRYMKQCPDQLLAGSSEPEKNLLFYPGSRVAKALGTQSLAVPMIFYQVVSEILRSGQLEKALDRAFRDAPETMFSSHQPHDASIKKAS